VKTASLEDFEWIIGTWERQNARPGVTHMEKWWKISDQHLKGFGLAMSGSDTTLYEGLGIKIEDGTPYYIAEVKENPGPVYFKIVSLEENSFVSENPEHEAPKKIEYRLDEKIMTATLSWDQGGFEIVFLKVE
jgi:hypothetical protein